MNCYTKNGPVNREGFISEEVRSYGISEDVAAASFIGEFMNTYDADHVLFHVCSLSNAISESCLAPIELRKILLLYFHNSSEPFSKLFCKNIASGKIKDLIESTFYMLAWDVKNDLYHESLKEAVNTNLDVDYIEQMITNKRAALFVILPVDNAVSVLTMLHGDTIDSDQLLTTLEQTKNIFLQEIQNEQQLANITRTQDSANDIGSKQFQQFMFDGLGDRDYDCFEFNEHQYLKEKIGFAIFGPPQSETGYDEKQNKQIDETYNVICTQNAKYCEWQDQIIISFIYNCTEPLPDEKLSRAKKYGDEYNPTTDICPLPIYVLKKCHGCADPCRIFIDHDHRVYYTWKDYIDDNKLPKRIMVLPKDGRYFGDENEDVQLETHLSPPCRLSSKILKGTDITTTIAGIASGGVFAAALIPAVVVAPVALVVAGVAGAGVGLYSLVRSAVQVRDRHVHCQSLSFANSEARGAYINIVAGALGFVGAGATAAVSQLAADGVNIGRGARVVVNAINMTNIGVSGIGVAHSTYQVVDQWVNEQEAPSMLTVVQLSSSILFFGNAVYNFKLAGTIIDEVQANSLKDYSATLRSNRHRKMFNKLVKETVRQNSGDTKSAHAEVISTIRNIGNRDEIFAVLTRNNKLFNEKGVRFSASGGEIKFNGVLVDIHEFGSVGDSHRTQLLVDLPSIPQPSANEANMNIITTELNFKNVFNAENLELVVVCGKNLVADNCSFTQLASALLSRFLPIIQEKIISVLKSLFDTCVSTGVDVFFLKTLFPNIEPLYMLLRICINFFKKKMNEYEEQYQKDKEEAQMQPHYNDDKFHEQYMVNPEKAKRTIEFFEKAVNLFTCVSAVRERRIQELVQYFTNFVASATLEFAKSFEKTRNRTSHSARSKETACQDCGGYNYKPT